MAYPNIPPEKLEQIINDWWIDAQHEPNDLLFVLAGRDPKEWRMDRDRWLDDGGAR